MKILFLDESGDSNLQSLDPYYPFFVLGGCIFDVADLKQIDQKIRDFKVHYWGTDKVILHTREIVRKIPPFEFLHEKKKRDTFYDELNALMNSLPFKTVACLIDKHKYLDRYGNNAIDAYEYSLHILIERLVYHLDGKETGLIKAEARGKIADKEIDLVWQSVCNKGTRYLKGSTIRQKIDGFSIHDKKENINGLQVADLIVSPIGRQYLGKRTNEDMRIIKKTFLKDGNGKEDGYGLVVLPQ